MLLKSLHCCPHPASMQAKQSSKQAHLLHRWSRRSQPTRCPSCKTPTCSGGICLGIDRPNALDSLVRHVLSGTISRDVAILSLRYPILRDTFSARSAAPQNCAIPRRAQILRSIRPVTGIQNPGTPKFLEQRPSNSSAAPDTKFLYKC